MTTADFDEKLRELFTFAPVVGKPNWMILAARPDEAPEPEGEPMTEADWDKFEEDVRSARRQ
jgi:hypothetical protein